MISASEEKWRTFIFFFQSREQVVVRRVQIRRIGRVIKTLEAQVGQYLLGCKCRVRHGIITQEQCWCLALQEKKLDDSSCLDVVEIVRVA